MEQIGTVINVGQIQTGTGKNGAWFKHEFVISFKDKTFDKILALQTWKDLTDVSSALKIGDVVDVAFNVESNEYNGKYYTGCKCYKIRVMANATVEVQPPANVFKNTSDNNNESDSLPF